MVAPILLLAFLLAGKIHESGEIDDALGLDGVPAALGGEDDAGDAVLGIVEEPYRQAINVFNSLLV